MVVSGSGPASAETDSEMWHFWLKGASSGIGYEFSNQKYLVRIPPLLLCVWGSEDLGKSLGLLEYYSPPVQSRDDTADPQRVVVRMQ